MLGSEDVLCCAGADEVNWVVFLLDVVDDVDVGWRDLGLGKVFLCIDGLGL